jgi:hypothetical protein
MTLAAAVALPAASSANDELLGLQKDAKLWTQANGNFANTRTASFATNAGNVAAQVAWQFSTGVLRGHEWYRCVRRHNTIHTPFPEHRFALDPTITDA